jgi:hypothetical protein
MDYAEVRDELESVEGKEDIKLKKNDEGTTGLYIKKQSTSGRFDFFFIGHIDEDDVTAVEELIKETWPVDIEQ